MADYLPLLCMAALAAVFAGVSIAASRVLNPGRPTVAKLSPYECGVEPARDVPERLPVRFYLVAMLFIMFDVEIIFLFPWAVISRRLGPFGLWEVLVFSAIFFVAFVYVIARGGIDWAPAHLQRRSALAVDPERTSTSTVRRVGLEGRPADVAASTPGEAA